MIARTLFFALAFLCLGFQAAFSQYGLKLTNLEHAGVYGELFKPALVPEFSFYLSEIDENSLAWFSIGFTMLQARQDTFFGYGIQSSGNATILPGYEIYEDIKYIPLTFYYAIRPFDGPLRPLFGVSLNANILFFNYKNNTATIISESIINENLNSAGIMPFLGGSYQANHQFSFQLEVGHQIAFDAIKNWNRQWRTSISTIFYID